MKMIFRIIGFLVVIIIVVALVLYTINSFGYLKGPLSHWINNIAGHCQGIVHDTTDFLEKEELLPVPESTDQAVPSASPALVLQSPTLL